MKKLISKHQKGKTINRALEDNLTYGLNKIGSALGIFSSIMEKPQRLMMEAFTGKDQLPSEAIGFKNIPQIKTSGAYMPYSANPFSNPKGNTVQVPATFKDMGNIAKHGANMALDSAADPLNALGGIGAWSKYAKGVAKGETLLYRDKTRKTLQRIADNKKQADLIEAEIKTHSVTPNPKVYNHILQEGLKGPYLKKFDIKLNPQQQMDLNSQKIKATQGSTPKLLNKNDFYSESELDNLIDEYANYQQAENTFEEMYPTDGSQMIMQALTGDKSRDELFKTLFPNVRKPQFNDKIIQPEHAAELKPILQRTEAINPNALRPNTLKRLNYGYDKPHEIVHNIKSMDDSFMQNDKAVVEEFSGDINIIPDQIDKLSPESLKKLADKIRNNLRTQSFERFKSQTPFTGTQAFQNLPINKTGGLIKKKK